jgi:hypothetical protein
MRDASQTLPARETDAWRRCATLGDIILAPRRRPADPALGFRRPPVQPVEVHGSTGHHHEREHGQKPRGALLVREVGFQEEGRWVKRLEGR